MHSSKSIGAGITTLTLLLGVALVGVVTANATPTTVTLQPSINPLAGLTGEANMAGLHCFSVTDCVAVGTDSSSEPIVLDGDPATWKPSQARQIAVPSGGSLSAVTCTSATNCIAVGATGSNEPLVLTGDPATWGTAQAHVLNYSGQGDFYAVTCSSPTACVAVGDNLAGEPIRLTGDPETWSASDIGEISLGAAFGKGGPLKTVACTSPTACVAGGNDYKGQPFTVSGDPTKWTPAQARQITLGPAFRSGGQLNSIACTSPRHCFAVGTDDDGRALGLIGNPATWSAANVVAVRGGPSFAGDGNINAVSCMSAVLCTVVGYDNDTQPYVLTGNPKTWSSARGRELTLGGAFGSGGMLQSVICLAGRVCVAVGNTISDRPLSITIKPTSWAANQVALTGAALGAYGSVSSLSCASATSCVAIGSGLGSWPVLVQGSPNSWDMAHATQMVLRDFTSFSSVDCPSLSECVAVGTGFESQPIVLQGDPAKWSEADIKQVPLGKAFGSGGQFTGVTCTSSTLCVAVGSDSEGQPIALRGDPADWTTAEVKLIAVGASLGDGGSLNAVTCASATACVAVGSDKASHLLVLSGNPATWNSADYKSIVLNSALGPTSDLTSVTCTSVTTCVAVGSEGKSPLVLVGDPSSWGASQAFSVSVPAPGPNAIGGYSPGGIDTNGSFVSVSCSSATQCLAVGGDGSGDPIFIQGDPAKWVGQSIERPAEEPSFSMANIGASECAGSICYIAGRTTSGLFLSKL